jgi:hypothetical protein
MTMGSTKAVRSVGLVVAVSALGLLFACAPTDTDGDVDVDTTTTLNPACAPGQIPDPTNPKTCVAAAVYSYCAGVVPALYHNTKPLPANTRLALITDGRVPCISLEDQNAKPATCKLPGTAVTVDTKAGSFAQVGQSIPVTQADGSVQVYVVASKVTATSTRLGVKYTVPCTAPAGADTAGTAVGQELAGACIVETMGVADNAALHKESNYATRTVCGTGANPDALNAPVSKNGTVVCYLGEGAGLNDINGTERDKTNTYLKGSDRCHVGWNSGHEVPAAKRPATYSYPVKVNENTPVVWRAVASGISIAN